MAIAPRWQSDDSALVQAARAGDRTAFADLVDRHRPLLEALCRRTLDDPSLAEDAAHEAILQAMVSLDRLHQPARFGSWLAGIGLNICRRALADRRNDHWSLDAVYGGRTGPEMLVETDDPAALAEEAELADRVRWAIAGLPSGQRAAVLLFYLSGLTYAETAAVLGIEVGAVKTRLHKARRALRGKLWTEWKEQTMTFEIDTNLVEARVVGIWREPSDDGTPRYVVKLHEVGGDRRLLIWIGAPEATAIAVYLDKVETPRPMTFGFMAAILQTLNGTLREVRVSRLVGEVFFAEAFLDTPTGATSIDARPSDALALALSVGAPIRVEASILDSAGMTRRAELPEDPGRLRISLRHSGVALEPVEGASNS